MKNNRGQFFAIYLVLLTLFMCAIVVGMYYFQSKTLDNSFVSPVEILKLEDIMKILFRLFFDSNHYLFLNYLLYLLERTRVLEGNLIYDYY